jgi:hypothetical protein
MPVIEASHGLSSRWLILPIFTDLMAVANAAFRRLPRILEQSDQYRATMMIATTRNAAISERARSSFFERGSALWAR